MVTAPKDGTPGRRASLDGLEVAFDDPRAVANAGLLLPATLAQRLGLEALVDEVVDLGQRAGAARPGRKVMTLVHAVMAGADSIDDCDLLRAGASAQVLGHRVMAPSRGPSPSATCASSIGRPRSPSPGPGPPGPAPGAGPW
jgi:hypothetical protein